jgi:hypothetical protein
MIQATRRICVTTHSPTAELGIVCVAGHAHVSRPGCSADRQGLDLCGHDNLSTCSGVHVLSSFRLPDQQARVTGHLYRYIAAHLLSLNSQRGLVWEQHT